MAVATHGARVASTYITSEEGWYAPDAHQTWTSTAPTRISWMASPESGDASDASNASSQSSGQCNLARQAARSARVLAGSVAGADSAAAVAGSGAGSAAV